MQSDKNWYSLFKVLTCSVGALASYKFIKEFITPKYGIPRLAVHPKRQRIISTLDETNLRTEMASKYQFQKHNERVIKIVFTGGPCSGKTTVITSTQELLKDLGYTVHIVPEAATFISNAGGQLDISEYQEQLQRQFQANLLRLQLTLEDRFCDLSIIENKNEDKPGILLCDRGLLDGSAYMSKENFQIMLDEMKSDIVSLRDKRYDAIIHLTTCADGAQDYYTLENNPARHEKNLNFAVWLDRTLLEAWQGHPYHYHIKAASTFTEKLNQAQEAVLQIVGLPSKLKYQKKFLLKNFEGNKSILKFLSSDVKTQQCLIEDTFLNLDNDKLIEKKVRKRDQNGLCSYLFIKRKFDLNQNISTHKSRISGKQFLRYLAQADSNYNKLVKTRTCFIMNARNFIIEEHLDPITMKPNFSILIVLIENTEGETMPQLPEFLEAGICREVTNDEQYFDYNIARKQWQLPDKDRNLFAY